MSCAYSAPAQAGGPAASLPGWGGAVDVRLIGRDAELAALRQLISKIRQKAVR